MPHHLLDLPLLLQIAQSLPGQAAIDLQAIDECSDCDEAVGLDVFVEFVRGGFVKDDGVVSLFLNYGEQGCWSVYASQMSHGAEGLEWRRRYWRNVPLPLDHFFFCFLPPAEVAAGAWEEER